MGHSQLCRTKCCSPATVTKPNCVQTCHRHLQGDSPWARLAYSFLFPPPGFRLPGWITSSRPFYRLLYTLVNPKLRHSDRVSNPCRHPEPGPILLLIRKLHFAARMTVASVGPGAAIKCDGTREIKIVLMVERFNRQLALEYENYPIAYKWPPFQAPCITAYQSRLVLKAGAQQNGTKNRQYRCRNPNSVQPSELHRPFCSRDLNRRAGKRR